jgi:hypothetical protein
MTAKPGALATIEHVAALVATYTARLSQLKATVTDASSDDVRASAQPTVRPVPNPATPVGFQDVRASARPTVRPVPNPQPRARPVPSPKATVTVAAAGPLPGAGDQRSQQADIQTTVRTSAVTTEAGPAAPAHVGSAQRPARPVPSPATPTADAGSVAATGRASAQRRVRRVTENQLASLNMAIRCVEATTASFQQAALTQAAVIAAHGRTSKILDKLPPGSTGPYRSCHSTHPTPNTSPLTLHSFA